MPDNIDRDPRRARRRRTVRSTLLSALILVLAAGLTLWLQRTFWPTGVLANLLPYTALLYILMLLPLAVSLRNRLKEIDKGEEDEASQY